MKKVLITGASGYLAHSLLPEAMKRGRVVGLARNENAISAEIETISVDLLDKFTLLDVVAAEKPDVIIHCAASNPGSDESQMIRINEEGSRHIAMAASANNSRLVAVSSDTVLNGENAPYDDDAMANPLPDFVYGQSKARAESAIAKENSDAIIVRTSLIYGLKHMDRGTQSFVNRLESGERLQLFTDVIRQPVFDEALSANLCQLAFDLPDESGTINVAGSEALSRYEFGISMLDFWDVKYSDKLDAISGSEFNGLPMDLRLNQDRAESLSLDTSGVSEVMAKKSG